MKDQEVKLEYLKYVILPLLKDVDIDEFLTEGILDRYKVLNLIKDKTNRELKYGYKTEESHGLR